MTRVPRKKSKRFFYRSLTSQAENVDDQPDIEALNGLLADEQHHLSRITVRLVELGIEVQPLTVEPVSCSYENWRAAARARELGEIARYEELLAQPLDEQTAEALRSILAVERAHEQHLGGKYTDA